MIERYNISIEYAHAEDGYWVRHEDHADIVRELKERISEAEDAIKGQLGNNSGYWLRWPTPVDGEVGKNG